MEPALQGLRVLDMTQYEAGPSCTQALAWMGADVVKVEPAGGDPGRGFGARRQGGAYFHHWNANKRSIVVDLATPDGHDLLLDLVPHYDVFVENYGPGVVDKLGLGYDAVAERNPSIIYASIKGFGLDGPYADYKCFDGVAQAASGAWSVTGEEGGPPLLPGPTLGDVGTGVQAALAITGAYVRRLQTGEGDRIELSMQEAMTYYLRTRLAFGSKWGTAAAPRAGRGRTALMSSYPTAGGGPNDHVIFMAVTERMWEGLTDTMGRPELRDDPRFADARSRMEHDADLAAELTAWCATRDKHEIMQLMGEAGVPCSAIMDTADLHRDPHLNARGFVQSMEHPDLGEVPVLGWPARTGADAVPITAGPGLGEHTDAVLADDLGLDDATLAALRSSGVIGTPE